MNQMGCDRCPSLTVHCHPDHTAEAGICSLDIAADDEPFLPVIFISNCNQIYGTMLS
jgi:hypothetical protein